MTTKTDNQQEQKAVVAPVNLDTFDWNAYENDLGVYNAPKEEIEAKYDQTLSKVQVGEVVEGTVISPQQTRGGRKHRLQVRRHHPRERIPLQPRHWP